jgi:membrane carboxypeptidase/penicillin-binding protein PbpC
VFLLDTTLRPEYQMLSLAARGGTGTLQWFVNGVALREAAPDEVVRWPLRRGRHDILVRDEAGREARSHLTVR